MKAVGLTRYLPISDPESLQDFELPGPVPGKRDSSGTGRSGFRESGRREGASTETWYRTGVRIEKATSRLRRTSRDKSSAF
jgi:hypothetical protein